MFTEVEGQLRHRYPRGAAAWTTMQEAERLQELVRMTLKEAQRLQPLVAAARSVRAVASSFALQYYFNIRIK